MAPGDLSRRLRRHMVDQPDPVDFRDFQRINLYAAGENMFHDRAGKRRPIARMGVIPVLYYDKFLPDGRRHRMGGPARFV